ncbi:hypothetical protein [Paenibacillus ihumii]|nr:hypothetical protein [Paenibacillus ihumii]
MNIEANFDFKHQHQDRHDHQHDTSTVIGTNMGMIISTTSVLSSAPRSA